MATIVYTKLGDHRGAKRLWLEGRKLLDAGAYPGCRFALELDVPTRTVTIVLTEDGERTISGKTKGDAPHPVLDINSAMLTAVLGAETNRVVARIEPGRITVTIAPDEEREHERRQRLKDKLRSGTTLDMASVFHGAGILDLAVHRGLARAGIDTRLAWAVEVEPRYLETSRRNNPLWDERSIAVEASADEVDPRHLTTCDILLAGIPCKGASLAGRARRADLDSAEEHPVGHLFVPLLAIIKAVNPVAILLENVPPYRSTPTMAVLRKCLDILGYDVHETILDGHELGALEARNRLGVVAMTKGIPFDWSALRPAAERPSSVGEVLDPPEVEHRWSACEGLRAKEKRDAERHAGHGTGFAMQIVMAASTAVPTIGHLYHKWRSTEPKLADPSRPGLLRQFSPAEHARIKGIPESLVAGEVPTFQHQMLGQSIAFPAFVAAGEVLGRALRAVSRPAAWAMRAARQAALPCPAPAQRPLL